MIDHNSAPIVSDAALEHWGRVYLSNPWMRRRGILFESFLRFPHEILGLGLDAPLPAQLDIRERVDATIDPVHRYRDYRSEILEEHTERMLAGRRVHVSDGRQIETVAHCRHLRVHQRHEHRPWRLGVTS